jgi:hypothetical protein
VVEHLPSTHKELDLIPSAEKKEEERKEGGKERKGKKEGRKGGREGGKGNQANVCRA